MYLHKIEESGMRKLVIALAALSCGALVSLATAADAKRIDPGRSMTPTSEEMTITAIDFGSARSAAGMLGDRPADGQANSSLSYHAGATDTAAAALT
jgi:hypothetical protein